LVELTRRIAESPRGAEAAALDGDFPIPLQRRFTSEVVRALGYDFARGRQDEAPHPFCTSFTRDDVRITTRFSDRTLTVGLYASLHECGHALYEQGFDSEIDGTPLAGGASSGIHESQSRLYENLVGRSRAFCRWILPRIQEAFPNTTRDWNVERLYRGVNRVAPSFIRVEADEVTYNLHILLRFELERELLAGRIQVRDLPDAWNVRMDEYLGITPQNDSVGVLQDVHWPAGLFGYFPTYTLGNVFSAQIWQSGRRSLPDLDKEIENGQFAALRDWLCESIHRHGRKYKPHELMEKATGEPPAARYYLEYLEAKFGEVYGL
jgi:carboxypeptidase Taq